MENIKSPSKSMVYRKAKECGATKPILKKILPNWWDDELLSTNTGLMQFALFLRHRLGIHMHLSDAGEVNFSPSPTALQFKKLSSTSYDKLSNSALLTQAVGKTFIRALRYNEVEQHTNAFFELLSKTIHIDMEVVVSQLWAHNIPVLYLDNFPVSFSRPAGTIIRDEDFYVIVLSHKHKSPSTQLFVLLHEIGHMKCGHLENSGVITDASVSALGETLKDETDHQEIEADEFALDLLRNGLDIQEMIKHLGSVERPGTLVLYAQKLNEKIGVNPGHFILSYGRESKNWILAHQALKFLEKGSAQEILKKHYRAALTKYDFKRDDLDLLERML